MNPQSPSRLPRRVLFALIGVTVVGAIVVFAYGVLSGWVPPRESAGVVLPLYFAMLLGALTLSFVICGNTLMYHYRSGTVQRATDDPKHPGLRQVLRSSERYFVASRPGSLVAGGFSGPRFSRQYPNSASMVSRAL
jgi:hypothetical protein